jgi:GAF domain-containing protein
MILDSFTVDAYTQHHKYLGDLLARNIVGVIVNSQMHRQIQRDSEERSTLAEISRIIDSSSDIQQVYRPFVEQVRKLIPSDRIIISMLSRNGEVATNTHVWGLELSGHNRGDSFPTRDTLFDETVRTRKTMVFRSHPKNISISRSPAFSRAVTADFRATIVSPLISEDEIIGVLSLRSRSVDAYSKDDVALTERIADQISGAVANTQLRMEAERNADLRERLATIGRIISSSLNIDEVYESFIEQVNALIPSDRISVQILNEDQRTATTTYEWGTYLPDFRPGDTHAVRGTSIQDLIDTRRGLLRVDEPLEQTLNSTPSQIAGVSQGLISLIATPLISGDKVIGGLVFRSKSPTAYGNRDLELAGLIAAQIAGAVANAQMHIQIQREADERSVLAEISRVMDSSTDIQDVFQQFTEQVNKLLPSDRIVIAILNQDGITATNAYVWGDKLPGYETGDSYEIPDSIIGRTAMENKSILLNVDSELAEFHPHPLEESGLQRLIMVPLMSEDRPLGVLSLRSKRANAYTEQDLRLAERISAQISGAVANAQLRLELQRDADLRERLATIGRIVSSSPDIDEVYDSFIEQVNVLIPSDRIVVSVFDIEQRIVTNAYVSGTEVAGYDSGTSNPIQNTFLRVALRTRKGSIVPDEATIPVIHRDKAQVAMLAHGLRSMVIAPLIAGDKVIGGLILRSKAPAAYGQRDLEIAELIAAQIAGAVANAQMHLQIQREAKERAALAEIGRIINSSVDTQDVYQSFVEVVNRMIPSDRIAIAQLNAQGDAVINTYVWGIEIDGLGIGGATPVHGTAIEVLFETGRGMVIGAESPEEFIARFPVQAASIAVGLRSMILVPMASDDKIIGTLLLRSKTPNAYDIRDMELAERIAAQISGAVANAQLHTDVQKQALERQVLNEIGRIISSTLDVEKVYDAFADRVRIPLPFDHLIINIGNPESEGLKRAYAVGSTGRHPPDKIVTTPRDSFLHDIITQKQTILFCPDNRDVAKETYPPLAKFFDQGCKHSAVVALPQSRWLRIVRLDSSDARYFQAALSTRFRSRSKLPRPYICLRMNFSLVT